MKRNGFTLIELLVVVAILGILLAMMVPAAGTVMRKAKTTQARADLQVVQTAMLKYRMEYNRWPSLEKPVKDGYYGTSEEWVDLMDPDVTTGKEGKRDGRNFRQLRFLEMGKGMRVPAGTKWAGAFGDPWAHDEGRVPYLYLTDDDGDGVIRPPAESEGEEQTAQILVWSAGPDGDYDTWEDNVTSWEQKK